MGDLGSPGFGDAGLTGRPFVGDADFEVFAETGAVGEARFGATGVAGLCSEAGVTGLAAAGVTGLGAGAGAARV